MGRLPTDFVIYYDSIQEGVWFQELHPDLTNATLAPFPPRASQSTALQQVLQYDRPDIILVHSTRPILVVERTVEVPTGHNVGQRFCRLVAAAQSRIPLIYFGPYAAYKHGGVTQGPRYMNLRLFAALQRLAEIESSAVTIINWPVDGDYEIIQDPVVRDARIRDYLDLFFPHYYDAGLQEISRILRASDFERIQEQERQDFAHREVTRPEIYERPPDSVVIQPRANMPALCRCNPIDLDHDEIVLYQIGMRYIRSDPYTGMTMLYSYLYCDGMRGRNERRRQLVLHFPHISIDMWNQAVQNGRERKDIRIYRNAADGILFQDGYVPHSQL